MAYYEWTDDEIKHRLEVNAMAVAKDLIPDAHAQIDQRQGHYKPRNPSRNDANPGSFVIFTKGERIGWHDFSSKAHPSHGDMISLIGLALGFDASSREGYPRALAWAARYFGLVEIDYKDLPKHAPIRRDAPVKPQSGGDVISSKKLMGQWLGGAAKLTAARSDLLDSPVERYLTRRGIDLAGTIKSASYKPACGAVRFHPDGRYYRGGGLEDYSKHPLIAAAMTNDDGKITALHRTYLTKDGYKADVPNVKKVRGSPVGSAIRLWRGKSGLSVKQAIKKGVRDTLVLLEGLEDGFHAVQMWPDYRIHVTYSCGNFLSQSWPDNIERLILFGDNDPGEAAAQDWDNICARFASLANGRHLTSMKPPPGIKDLNDWFKGLVV